MLSENFSIAIRAIFANKMRSILTVLGVMIGVAAVIAVVSLVQGLQKRISEELESVGSTFIRVIPDLGVQSNPFLQKMPELTYEDALAIKKSAPTIRNVTPIFLHQPQVRYGDARHTPTMMAVNQTYQEVVNNWVEHGRFFTTLDEEANKRVAVVGDQVPRKLGIRDPIGKVIQV
ncbi:MAG TPA: ABC transporter permease, partial [Thermoanaerobaculia bacterium]